MGALDSYKGFVSDLDGVFFWGNKTHPAAADFVRAVRKRGMPITFASNGSGGRKAVVQKMEAAGVEGVQEEDVMTAGYATAVHLCQEQERVRDMIVLMLGPQELLEECEKQGIGPMLTKADVWDAKDKRWIAERVPTHLVTGRHDFNPAAVEAAVASLRRGSAWVTTATDAAVTSESGDLRAGTGTFVAAIQRLDSAGREPTYVPTPHVIGKPNPAMVCACLERMGIPAELTIMLGDSIETDMTVGQILGMQRALVLSGLTDPETAKVLRSQYDAVYQDIAAIRDVLSA